MLTSFSLAKKTQRFLLTYLLLSLPIIAVGMTIYYTEVKTNKISLEIQATENLKGQFELILNEFKNVVSDLLFLAEHNEIQVLLNTNNSDTRQKLVEEYLAFIKHKKNYDQVRFLDETGQEIARANFNQNKPFIVSPEKLQNKGSRYYFKDAFVLNRGEIFVSPFDLNIERGQVEQPLKPMLRFGTPVFDQHGNKRGIVLLNYLGNGLLKRMQHLTIKNFFEIMLLNQQGFWLLSPNPDDEWGFMLEAKSDKTFGKHFPSEWQTINLQQNGQFYTENGLFAFTTIYPLTDGYKSTTGARTAKASSSGNLKILEYYWKLVSHIPSTVLTINSQQVLANIRTPFIGLMVLMAIIALILTRIGIKHARAEAFLQRSDEQLRLLIDGVTDYAIIMLDPQGQVASWNTGAERITQYTADEIIGKHLSTFYLPENILGGEVERLLINATREGKTEDEGWRICKNGSGYWAHVTITALRKKDGTLRGFTNVIRDITETKNTEAHIRQNEMMFRTLYEASGDAIILLDESGFFDCNTATQKMFGGDTKEQFISCHFSDFSPSTQPNGEDSKTLANQHIQTAIEKGSLNFEWLYWRLDKTSFYAEVSLNSLKLYDWPVLQTVIRDVTERKQAEAKIKLANEQIQELNEQLLSENQRMSAKLEITRQLQQMMLPKEQELREIKDLDVSGFMKPAEIVGGDYYDVMQYGGHVLLAIGDVTGHGLESGVLAIMVQTAVRTMLAHNEATDLAKFLNTLNDVIYSNVQRMNSDKNLTFAILDYQPISFTSQPKSGDIKGILCLSGQHETMIIVRVTGEIEEIDTIDLGFPMGLEADVSEWINQVSVSLKAGDVVVLYTDGITEAENCNKEFYGSEQLCEIIKLNRHLAAEDIRRTVIRDLLKFIDKQEVFDDITLLILKQK